MARLRSVLEWALILVLLIVIGYFGYTFVFSPPATNTSGLPGGTGGFFQEPLPAPETFTTTKGTWQFTFTSGYSYTAAGKIVGRHEFPAAMPDGIIPLDLAVANGDLLIHDNLEFFTFTMGDRTLKYSYDVPNYAGLTEDYIDEHISNNHLVFLNASLEQEAKQAEVGDCIIVTGKLVDISGVSGGNTFSGRTSTVRNDEYPEGCEVILVDTFTPVRCGS